MVQRVLTSTNANGSNPVWGAVFASVPDTSYILQVAPNGTPNWVLKSAANQKYVLVGETDNQTPLWIVRPTSAPTFTEIARWAAGNEGPTAAAYVPRAGSQASNPVWCFGHTPSSGTFTQTTIIAGNTYQVEYVPGDEATQAAGTVTGVAINDFNGSGFTCRQIGSFSDNTDTFGNADAGGGNIPPRFLPGTIILRSQN